VKDVLSYIRAAKNPDAPGDISRAVSTPPRGIGKTTLSKMLLNEVATLAPAAQKKVEDFMQLLKKIENAGRTLKPSEVVTFVIQESGLEGMFKKDGTEGEERLQNVRELVSLATKYDELEIPTGLDTFLDDAALAADQDALNEQQHSVKLMTIHAAKGLEFKYVFLIGLEQGVFPSEREDENKDDEEERRLMYVAVTRAREKLYISYAMMRTIYGQTHVTVPSEFISDIPSHTIEQDADRGSSGRKTMDLIDF
jgi:DNA helicase-2/ATP-dependent DNA helicase PcrA